MSGISIHPEVLHLGSEFQAVGMSTPSTFRRKSDRFLHPRHPGESVAIVVGDAVRCSTTIISALAAGARAVTVEVKDRTDALRKAERVGRALGAGTVFGGELHGRPMPGAVIGNSPRDVSPDLLCGKHLHFRSTNFGAVYVDVGAAIKRFGAEGGGADVYVVCFANAIATAQAILAGKYARIFIAVGGFYDQISLE